jgi:hypothetical protein
VAALAAWLSVLGLVALPGSVAAQTMPMTQAGPTLRVDSTPNFTVLLDIGPAETMLMPSQAMGATSGEVMVTGGPMSMPAASTSSSSGNSSMSTPSASMSMGNTSGSMDMSSTMFDQGMPANHHLEVHIEDRSGMVVNSVTPDIRVTDKMSGVRRDLNDVMGMYGVQMGPSDFHYGQNVWLPDGTYTVTVMIGSDTAEFRDVTVSGGQMSGMAMSTPMSMP